MSTPQFELRQLPADTSQKFPAIMAGLSGLAGAGAGGIAGGGLGLAYDWLAGGDDTMTPEQRSNLRASRILKALTLGGLAGGGLGGVGGYQLGERGLAQQGGNLHALRKVSFDRSDINKLIPEESPVWKDVFLTPEAYRRAGRATGLAESMGQEAPFHAKNPRVSSLVDVTGGALAGGLLGTGLGALVDSSSPQMLNGAGMGVGAGSGVALGSVGGLIYNIVKRRRAVLDAKRNAEKALSNGTKSDASKIDQGHYISSPFTGVHLQGRADAAEAVSKGKHTENDNPYMAASMALSPVPFIGPAAGLFHVGGSVSNFSSARDRLKAVQ